MKILIKILLLLSVFVSFISCEKELSSSPLARITIDKTTLALNESMTIHFTGVADQVVVYPGDNMQDYELRKQSNTGLVVNKNILTYSYSVPGTYKVVCLATTYLDMGIDLKTDTTSIIVTVIDDQTEITKLSCTFLNYFEVEANKRSGDDWLLVLPRKISYNNITPEVKLSQKLNFDIPSDSTKVFINDELYSSKKNYDLSAPLDILIRSYAGTERMYKLYTLYYPEFKTFKFSGVEGVLVRNEFDYTSFELRVTLPSGTDVSSLIPEFELYNTTDKVYIDEEEQTSGVSVVDFSKNVTYRLVSIDSTNTNMQSVSTIKITINN